METWTEKFDDLETYQMTMNIIMRDLFNEPWGLELWKRQYRDLSLHEKAMALSFILSNLNEDGSDSFVVELLKWHWPDAPVDAVKRHYRDGIKIYISNSNRVSDDYLSGIEWDFYMEAMDTKLADGMFCAFDLNY